MISFIDRNGELCDPDPDLSIAGHLPYFFDPKDPRPAAAQLHENYGHGGGWRPMQGFRYTKQALYYPGDPPYPLAALAYLRGEELRLYRSAWLAIVQPDGSFEVGRVD